MSKIIGMGIDGSNNHVFTWYSDNKVIAGSSAKLGSKRKFRTYTLPGGREPEDIVGMAIDGSNNYVFAWYRDGMVSAGTSTNLGSRRDAVPYELPGKREPEDIVGMGIDGFVLQLTLNKIMEVIDAGSEGDDKATMIKNGIKALSKLMTILTFAWYRDGMVSAGISTNLSEVRMPYNYTR